MLVFLTALMVLIPAIAIAYPFIRKTPAAKIHHVDNSTFSQLETNWEAALNGLRSVELEWDLGNLDESDYQWLRDQYLTDGALVIKAMELDYEQEQILLSEMQQEIQQAQIPVEDPENIPHQEPGR